METHKQVLMKLNGHFWLNSAGVGAGTTAEVENNKQVNAKEGKTETKGRRCVKS